MKIIKNAIPHIAYITKTPEQLADLMEPLLFAPVGPASRMSTGFVANPYTDQLVTPVFGGFALYLRTDEKIMPVASVAAAVAAKQNEAETERGAALTEEEAEALREATVAELLATALIRTSYALAMYHAETERLFVCSTSKDAAATFRDLLRKMDDKAQIKEMTIPALRSQLTLCLQCHLDSPGDDQSAFAPFTLGDYCQLKLKSDKLTCDLKNLSTVSASMLDAITTGMQVETIELGHETMSFKVTKDCHLRRVRYFGELSEDEMAALAELDSQALWRHEAGVQLAELAAATQALCDKLALEDHAG